MSSFDIAWERTGLAEGGYSNDLSDSGGETNWGITKRVARQAGYMGPMRELSRERARKIGKRKYWDSLSLDEVARMSPSIAFEIFDTGFNMGQERAAEFLQRSLNVFNRRGKDYPDIKVDGDIGPGTLGALRSYIDRRGTKVLLKALNCLQGAFYIKLAERREKDERFVRGWLDHRVSL